MPFMDRALSLARGALGKVSPNPAVGAVVVKNGTVVGEGCTRQPGGPHAEVVALAQAGSQTAGATLYTTLEPCNHHGRTPPCIRAVIDAGIAVVHTALIDPNPDVDGRGIAALRAAGLEVAVGLDDAAAESAAEIVEAYTKHITTGVPFVTAKFAMSLDGKIAAHTGDSRWITGEDARRHAHGLRAASDAVMAGVGTILEDDPQLTARDSSGVPREHQPLRVVVDSSGRTPADAAMLAEPGCTLVAVAGIDRETEARLQRGGAEVAVLPAADGRVDLAALLRLLGGRDVTSLLVEGGGTLLGSLFDQGLVDKVVACIAPTVIGGHAAPTAVGGTGVKLVRDAIRLGGVGLLQLGRDLVVTGYCRETRWVAGDRPESETSK